MATRPPAGIAAFGVTFSNGSTTSAGVTTVVPYTIEYTSGILNNAGGVLGSGSPLTNLDLDGGTIQGGTVNVAGLNLSIDADAGSSTLDGVTVIGNLTVDYDSATQTGGILTLTDGTQIFCR